jgi:hypothetical protein
MDKGSWTVLSLKVILGAGTALVVLLAILNKIPAWLVLFPVAPYIFFAIRQIIKRKGSV